MEASKTISGEMLCKMVLAGCNNLRAHVQEVNNLNVFPIPDGDTGSNMLLTIAGGSDTAQNGASDIGDVSRRISDGMLLSARGNSGVILSQIFRGVADGLSGLAKADNQAITNALRMGVQHSYNAVMEPAEGTMLTVMRCAVEYIENSAAENPEILLRDFLFAARNTLEKTPEMLPVLKKAGVVDSGGAGLIYIAEGMLKALTGVEAEKVSDTVFQAEQEPDLKLFTEDSVLEYGYCTELLLRLQKCKTDPDAFDINILTEYLKNTGDSVVAFKTGSIVKIHIHTKTPDKVLAFCQKYGEFLKIKIENMSLQHSSTVKDVINTSLKPEKSERKSYAAVAVASGDGIKQLFRDSGASVIVDGGESMNPSVEDFLEAFRRANADTIFVFPNNGNIILTAKQAAEMYKDSDVRVISSRTIGDGYAALSMLSYTGDDTEKTVNELNSAMEGVVTAEVSVSMRDTEKAHAGEYIGFSGKEIIAADSSREQAATDTIAALNTGKYAVCILIRGKDADKSEAERIEKYITLHYPETEVYLVDGMQDIYDYIIILE